MEITGNRANNSGQDMYGAYVTGCLPPLYNGQSTTAVKANVHLRSICHQTLISSDPVRLVLCHDSCVNTSVEVMTYVIPQLFPGQEFNFTVAAIGEYFGLTPAIISLSSYDVILNINSPDTSVSIKYENIEAQCTTLFQKLELKESIEEAIINSSIADESLPSIDLLRG